jgi:hypothetical protein
LGGGGGRGREEGATTTAPPEGGGDEFYNFEFFSQNLQIFKICVIYLPYRFLSVHCCSLNTKLFLVGVLSTKKNKIHCGILQKIKMKFKKPP